MRSLVKALIASTALLIPMSQVCVAQAVDGSDGSDDTSYETAQYPSNYGGTQQSTGEANIVNGQMNWNNIWSGNNLTVSNVAGDVVGSASAVGNNAEILTMQDSTVKNVQVNTGNVGAELNANLWNVQGSVQLTSTSLCNGVSVSTDPTLTQVHSNQQCLGQDPSATTNAQIAGGVGGDVILGATAVANQIEVDSNAQHFPVVNMQANASSTTANVNGHVSGVVGSVQSTSAAVGNTAQIIHYSTN